MQAPGPTLSNGGKEITGASMGGSKHDPNKALWLDAWHDPVSGIKAYSQCLRLADLNGDGDWRLLVADSDKKLKVWRGTTLSSEHALLDLPVAIATFYSDASQPRLPALAVASGSNIFIYRNLRPYYKFTLPPVVIDPSEAEVWNQLKANAIDGASAQEGLAAIRDNGATLTSRSLDLLSIEEPGAREQFVIGVKDVPLVQHTVVTCMETVKKNVDEPDAVSCLVVGTEAGQVLILDPSGTQIDRTCQLRSVPTMLAVTGLMDVEYRICVAGRDGNIYTIKNGEVTGTVVELEAQPVGLVRSGKSILVGCMNNVLYSYHIKGKKNYSIYLPASIVAMELLEVVRQRMVKCLVVGMANGEVRVYNDKHLVNVLQAGEPVMGLRFGRFGREDNTLLYTGRSGALSIKMLPRSANLEVTSNTTGPPPEQDIPLNVPKKTKLYVEQTQREREQAIDMHRIFQRDLCKLRLQTARAYVKVLSDGQGPISYSSGSSLRLNAQVQGLGPLFKIKMNVQNTGSKPIAGVPIMVSYNQELYTASRSQIVIPVLVPGLMYVSEVDVHCLDPNGAADVVRLCVLNPKSCVPVLSAVVKMPISSEVAM
mmetsp:Transcript_47681/g.152835  ORF Transcript_47681/g.152835 Transcript_47681/m.152835 type:complete len:596 (+) Transcript_47681:319-2106(+)|eukprot:CAMPEP_0182875096 /NCGR_PEP_ID=MMETSP0034_2-20130328/13328_1 /TAXON_ID=156128 /ORGANISM="Nephroselmis pyriformis, Strain CCMP717" /LENGTH=595 /DNA_ID=CAMNT_0025007829 /DNA_START=131 /DNA_END=1918 /DNA_ORIENTATION=-